MKKIEHGLELCFNEDSGDEESNEKEGNYVDDKKEIENSEDNQLESIKENIIVHKPFCRINQVQFGSPAEQAGLKAGDLVIEFGYANEDNHRNFQAYSHRLPFRQIAFRIVFLLGISATVFHADPDACSTPSLRALLHGSQFPQILILMHRFRSRSRRNQPTQEM